MAKKKKKRIIRFPKYIHLNVGVLIFLFIFVYISVSVVSSFFKTEITYYEVEGVSTFSDISEYDALILRDETITNADNSGTLQYYTRDQGRVSVNEIVCSINDGNIETAPGIHSDAAELSDEQINSLKSLFVELTADYSGMDYDRVYDLQDDAQATLLKYSSEAALSDIADSGAGEIEGLNLCRTDISGLLMHYVDGFESLTSLDLTESCFDLDSYERTDINSGKLVEQGTPIYKTITSENWCLCFPLTNEDRVRYAGAQTIDFRFDGDDTLYTETFSEITGKDGNMYGKIDMNRYMINYADERYAHLEIINENTEGYKIPVSAVLDKTFYLVPEEYIAYGGNSLSPGFYLEKYSDDGKAIVFTPATIYFEKDGECYVDTSDFHAGDYIVRPESEERFQMGPSDTLRGVYNMNKGYALFRQIGIIKEIEDYYLVEAGVPYSISSYDHIILDVNGIEENDILY